MSAFPRHMKSIVRLLTALAAMWAVSGHAQTVFPISENDVDASGTVLMCPKSNIYAPCRDTGSLPLPVEFGGALNLFLPRHRETQEANADASGTAQANVDALGYRANVSVAREHLRALCRGRHFAAHGRGREGAKTFCAGHHAES
jgi:hypothetical protein